MDHDVAVQMTGVTKTFGEVIASDKVDLNIRKGEILALLGENGSGKTTLMNMLSGIYYPDAGHIYINEEGVSQHLGGDSGFFDHAAVFGQIAKQNRETAGDRKSVV